MSTVYIPAKVRGPIYTAYGVIGLAIGATQVGYAAADAGQPTWLTVSLAVFAFLGVGIGYTAASNTPTERKPDDLDGEVVDVTDDYQPSPRRFVDEDGDGTPDIR